MDDAACTKELLAQLKFHLDLEHPDYEEFYFFGYEAAQAGLPEEENPYQEGGQGYEAWAEGWWDGFYGVKPLFQDEEKTSTSSHPMNQEEIEFCPTEFWLPLMKFGATATATVILGYELLDLLIVT